MCMARWRKYCHVSSTNTARLNCSVGTMYQYRAFATTISHAANAGTREPVISSPICTRGYFPPASTAASTGWDPDTFCEIAVAFKPTSPSSCGRALCAMRNLVAQHAISYSSFPIISSGSVKLSTIPITACIICWMMTSRATSYRETWLRFKISAGVCSLYCGHISLTSM